MNEKTILNRTRQAIAIPRVWQQFWKAYNFKKHTNQSFLATVVAIQVLLLAIFFLGVALVVVKKSNFNSAGASIFFKSL